MEAMKVGVVGCGAVSRMYLPILARSPWVDLVAAGDLEMERARAAAAEHGIGRAATPDQIIADPDVELVVNLTPIPVHVEVSGAALAAGKHVYSEKPLATSPADAVALTEEAKRRGLGMACAPDTMLGSGFQASRAALSEGVVGRPIGASAFMFRSALAGRGLYPVGPFPFFDMGPYYVSALVNLFGPARRVTGATRTLTADEAAEGQNGRPIVVAGTLEFDGGVVAELLLAWGTSHRSEVPVLTVYGTDGALELPNPNYFGDPGFVTGHGGGERREIAGTRQPEDWPRNQRGLGVADLVRSVREGIEPIASADVACHVVEVIAGLVDSASSGTRVEMSTTCRPAPTLSPAARAELLGAPA